MISLQKKLFGSKKIFSTHVYTFIVQNDQIYFKPFLIKIQQISLVETTNSIDLRMFLLSMVNFISALSWIILLYLLLIHINCQRHLEPWPP